jgi:hypothetical protein
MSSFIFFKVLVKKILSPLPLSMSTLLSLEPMTTGFGTSGNCPDSEKLPLIRVGEGDGYLRPLERGQNRWFDVHDFPSSGLLSPSVG